MNFMKHSFTQRRKGETVVHVAVREEVKRRKRIKMAYNLTLFSVTYKLRFSFVCLSLRQSIHINANYLYYY